MNPYRKIEPEEVAKARLGADLDQFHAAISAFKSIRDENMPASDDYWWAATAAAAYRAGRMSMWRDLRRRRGRKTEKELERLRHGDLEGLHHGDSEN